MAQTGHGCPCADASDRAGGQPDVLRSPKGVRMTLGQLSCQHGHRPAVASISTMGLSSKQARIPAHSKNPLYVTPAWKVFWASKIVLTEV